jgi:hypothetical protein
MVAAAVPHRLTPRDGSSGPARGPDTEEAVAALIAILGDATRVGG